MDKTLLEICYKKYNKETQMSWSEIASQYGYCSAEAIRSKFKKYRKANGTLKAKDIINGIINGIIIGNGDRELIIPVPSNPPPNYKESVEIKQDNSQVSDKVISLSDEELKDVNFILKSHNYEPDAWELISAKHSIWNVNTKVDGVKSLYSSKISVRPKTEYQWNEEDAKKIFSSLETCTKTINKSNIKTTQYKKNGKLLIVPISDFHLNLLSDKLSTGNEYNMQIAEDIFFQVINDVIDRVEDKVLSENQK